MNVGYFLCQRDLGILRLRRHGNFGICCHTVDRGDVLQAALVHVGLGHGVGRLDGDLVAGGHGGDDGLAVDDVIAGSRDDLGAGHLGHGHVGLGGVAGVGHGDLELGGLALLEGAGVAGSLVDQLLDGGQGRSVLHLRRHLVLLISVRGHRVGDVVVDGLDGVGVGYGDGLAGAQALERCVGEVHCAAEVALNGDARATEIDQRVFQSDGIGILDAPRVRDGDLVVDDLAGLEGSILAGSRVRDALLDGVLRRLGLPDREKDVVACSQRIAAARSIFGNGTIFIGAPAEEIVPLPKGDLARHYDAGARLAGGRIDGAGGTVQVV